MKPSFKLPPHLNPSRVIGGLLLILFSPEATAQEKKDVTPPVGFIRIANAVAPGTGTVRVKVNGKEPYPAGYKFAAVTGGIGLLPGSHTVKFERDGVKEGTTTITVSKDQTVTLIPYAERVPATDLEPAHFTIRVLRLKQKDVQNGRSASFVSVSGQPEVHVELRDPAGKWEKLAVKRLSISQATIHYPEGYAPIKVNGKELEPIPISDLGNYVVLLYDDPNGAIHAVNFRDFKYLSAD
jgi:hypothetical protein